MLIRNIKALLISFFVFFIFTIDAQTNPSYAVSNSKISVNHKYKVVCYSPGTKGDDTVFVEESNKVYTKNKETYLYVDLDDGSNKIMLNLPCIVTEKNGSESPPKSPNKYSIICFSPGATDGNIIFSSESPKIKSFENEEIIFVDLPNGDRVGITNLACITTRK